MYRRYRIRSRSTRRRSFRRRRITRRPIRRIIRRTVRRMAETKRIIDYAGFNYQIPTGFAPNLYSYSPSIAVGSNRFQRVGDKVQAMSWKMNILISRYWNSTTVAQRTGNLRVIVGMMRNDQAGPIASDILQYDDNMTQTERVNAFVNTFNFRVFYDRVFHLGYTNTTLSANLGETPTQTNVRLKKTWKKQLIFRTQDTVTQDPGNVLHYLFVSDDEVNTIYNICCSSMLYYKDI